MDPPASVDGGRLVLAEQIGAGAQAAVHAATRDGAARAVKIVGTANASPRLLGEVAALTAVHDAHLVRVYGAGSDDRWQWIEMERLHGQTLAQATKDAGGLPPAESLAITFELCMGLAALHDRGIVHRDIKPSNIFLSDAPRRLRDGTPSPGPAGGRVVLADLGVAQLPAGDVGYMTITGTNLGTVDYAAPEQADDSKRVGPAADQYGVGATLYATTTGRRPSLLFAGDDMPEVWAHLPEVLRPVVMRACDHDDEARYDNVRDLARALAAAHEALTGTPCVDAWMAAFDTTTPKPWFGARWWWTFRRWMR